MNRNVVKKYVKVATLVEEDGSIKPLCVFWDDGRRFEIDRIIDCRPAASLKAGGQGVRYTCRILGTESYLYFENPRWFVEEKVR